MAKTEAELIRLQTKLISGKADEVDLICACVAINELRELRTWRDMAFQAHPNLDMDIESHCETVKRLATWRDLNGENHYG